MRDGRRAINYPAILIQRGLCDRGHMSCSEVELRAWTVYPTTQSTSKIFLKFQMNRRSKENQPCRSVPRVRIEMNILPLMLKLVLSFWQKNIQRMVDMLMRQRRSRCKRITHNVTNSKLMWRKSMRPRLSMKAHIVKYCRTVSAVYTGYSDEFSPIDSCAYPYR